MELRQTHAPRDIRVGFSAACATTAYFWEVEKVDGGFRRVVQQLS